MRRATLPVHLTEELIDQLRLLGEKAKPNEACGVLLPEPFHGRQVIELPNRSQEPTTSFECTSVDLYEAIEDWVHWVGRESWNDITIWHTHPGGNIGPSGMDMRARVMDLSYLVIALTPDGPVPTWF
jgi:proteasome lid subunit RPN8/RPN11